MSLYDKPVKLLFRDMLKELSLQKGDIIRRDNIISWFKEKYPLVKTGTISAHLTKFSTNAPSRLHHPVDKSGKDDLFFQIDNKRFRLFDSSSDPEPIHSKEDVEKIDTLEDNILGDESEFAYERDLQNFLAKNLSLIEDGLELYIEEEINGIEFPVGNKFIDILAVDNNKDYVVIELKVSRGHDRVVGQLLRYMGWIRKYHTDKDQKVRGIILAREISDDLLLACSEVSNVELYEYNLSVSLKQINNHAI